MGWQEPLRGVFQALHAPWWLEGALVDGVYRTVAWVVSVHGYRQHNAAHQQRSGGDGVPQSAAGDKGRASSSTWQASFSRWAGSWVWTGLSCWGEISAAHWISVQARWISIQSAAPTAVGKRMANDVHLTLRVSFQIVKQVVPQGK